MVDGRRGCVLLLLLGEGTFQGDGQRHTGGGDTCRLGRSARTSPVHTSVCGECCRANCSLRVDLKEFQGECYSALKNKSGHLVIKGH